jgi:nucleoside-diphosphate-sugar epimerase
VCGATGFIGRNIAEALARRDDLEVHAVRFTRSSYDTPGLVWHQADLRRDEEVRRLVEGMDVIVQAAATTSGAADIVTRPYIHVTDNAVMNSLLLRAAFDFKVRNFIFFSCTVMYPSSEELLSEADWNAGIPIHPRYFGVGSTKVYIEQMCEFFSRLGVTRHTAIRHSNIYGPYDKFDLRRSHVFGATVTKVLTAKDSITVWGSGEEARDLLHVDDLVRLVELAMDRQETAYELVNAGIGRAVAVKDLVRMIVDASGRELRIEHDLTKPSIKTSLALDCGLAEALYGWRPEVGLEEGIRRTIDWWRSAFGNDPSHLLG